ncbi:DoxX family protein [Streptomyces sp. enrichment culture]|uniref:DoxX family protein n=1 Tax=Streptomyces sp. enrichment culture TaxID=1795815 RepID=UPI003F560FF1
MPRSDRSPLLLAGLLATAGVAHFAAPRPFDAIVPDALPGKPRTWTYASGAVELALAAGLALPRTRRTAALATAAFFVGVFPANVKMAADWRHRPTPQKAAAFGRLPLQVPLVLWARGVARNAQGRS